METNNKIKTITDDLAEFDYDDKCMVVRLLEAWNSERLPTVFFQSGIKIARYTYSVCLINDENQVAMLNGEKLERYLFLPHDEDVEGFIEDIVTKYTPEDFDEFEDVYYIRDYANQARYRLPDNWFFYDYHKDDD